jgi:RluA family pseudouridine synthase
MSSKLTRKITSKVPVTYAGSSLINYLTGRYTYHSESNWLEAIANSEILVNQVTANDPSQTLKRDDEVTYVYTGAEEPEVDFSYTVLYEDEHLLVLNKSGNLPVHPAGPFFNHTLWAVLKQKYENVHLINRLDRETSGVILVGLSQAAASNLAVQFQNREVSKSYLALVIGELKEKHDAKGYLIQDEQSEVRKKMRFIADENYQQYGKNGVSTEFEPLHQFNKRTLVKISINTGKMHQIRATLFSLGFPLVGDKIYGLDDTIYIRFVTGTLTKADEELMEINRQALHASELSFKHPVSDEEIHIKAPLPPDMQELLEK